MSLYCASGDTFWCLKRRHECCLRVIGSSGGKTDGSAPHSSERERTQPRYRLVVEELTCERGMNEHPTDLVEKVLDLECGRGRKTVSAGRVEGSGRGSRAALGATDLVELLIRGMLQIHASHLASKSLEVLCVGTGRERQRLGVERGGDGHGGQGRREVEGDGGRARR